MASKKGKLDYSREDLIEELKLVRNLVKNIPTSEDWKTYSRFSISAVSELFGNWEKFKEEAATISFIESDILNVFDLTGKIPEILDYCSLGGHPIQNVLACYKADNWSGVIKGLAKSLRGRQLTEGTKQRFLAAMAEFSLPETGSEGGFSDKKLFAELIRVYNHLSYRPNASDWSKFAKVSTYAVKNRLGTWKNFLQAGGMFASSIKAKSSANPKKPTKLQMIKFLQSAAAAGTSQPLTQAEYKRHAKNKKGYRVDSIILAFGNWENALVAANLPLRVKATPENVKDELEKLRAELNRYPSSKDYEQHGKFSYKAVVKLFGKGWRDVLKNVFSLAEEDLRAAVQRDPTSDEEYLRRLREMAESSGYSPTMTQAHNNGINVSRLSKRYKNWNLVIEEAGIADYPRYRILSEERKNTISNEKIIEEFKKVMDIVKQIPNTEQIRTYSSVSHTTITKRFGSGSYRLAVKNLCEMLNIDYSSTPYANFDEDKFDIKDGKVFVKIDLSADTYDKFSTDAESQRRQHGPHAAWLILLGMTFLGKDVSQYFPALLNEREFLLAKKLGIDFRKNKLGN